MTSSLFHSGDKFVKTKKWVAAAAKLRIPTTKYTALCRPTHRFIWKGTWFIKFRYKVSMWYIRQKLYETLRGNEFLFKISTPCKSQLLVNYKWNKICILEFLPCAVDFVKLAKSIQSKLLPKLVFWELVISIESFLWDFSLLEKAIQAHIFIQASKTVVEIVSEVSSIQ